MAPGTMSCSHGKYQSVSHRWLYQIFFGARHFHGINKCKSKMNEFLVYKLGEGISICSLKVPVSTQFINKFSLHHHVGF